METPDVPEDCLNDDHEFDQTGRCENCGMDRVDTTDGYKERRTGGAGSLMQPSTDAEYRDAKRNLGGR